MGGGVLADDMGLGKTLSTLALAVRTLQEGKDWAQKKQSEEQKSGKTQRYTHSTLVIVPSARELSPLQVAHGIWLTTGSTDQQLDG